MQAQVIKCKKCDTHPAINGTGYSFPKSSPKSSMWVSSNSYIRSQQSSPQSDRSSQLNCSNALKTTNNIF